MQKDFLVLDGMIIKYMVQLTYKLKFMWSVLTSSPQVAQSYLQAVS